MFWFFKLNHESALISEQPLIRIDIVHLIRDPSNRSQIWEYSVNQQDEIQRAYINFEPYQPLMSHWFKSYSWLEYSEKNIAFCFPCYLFPSKSSGKPRWDIFTVKGFNCWKKVNDGERCAFFTHMGKGPNSARRFATRCLKILKNHSCHIEKVVKRQTTQEILNNRLRIKASIDIVHWLTFWTCAFRRHDECPE